MRTRSSPRRIERDRSSVRAPAGEAVLACPDTRGLGRSGDPDGAPLVGRGTLAGPPPRRGGAAGPGAPDLHPHRPDLAVRAGSDPLATRAGDAVVAAAARRALAAAAAGPRDGARGRPSLAL